MRGAKGRRGELVFLPPQNSEVGVFQGGFSIFWGEAGEPHAQLGGKVKLKKEGAKAQSVSRAGEGGAEERFPPLGDAVQADRGRGAKDREHSTEGGV